jgi:hypothetical protein
MVEREINTELACSRIHHANALRHDFLANSVSGNDGDTMFAHGGSEKKLT